jgi:hypothetical protein
MDDDIEEPLVADGVIGEAGEASKVRADIIISWIQLDQQEQEDRIAAHKNDVLRQKEERKEKEERTRKQCKGVRSAKNNRLVYTFVPIVIT